VADVLRFSDGQAFDDFFKIHPQTHQMSEICKLLRDSPILQAGLIPWGSNYTFVVTLDVGQHAPLLGVYKPRRGEAPLWDFPEGTLYKREFSAFLLSEALGWGIVPPTVVRDGPNGVGTVQLYMHHRREDADYFSLREAHARDVKRMAVFDLIVNNTDRKAGHCLRDEVGHIWGIDHGLTFNLHSGLRTVIWDFGGERISKRLVRAMERVSEELETQQEPVCGLYEWLAPQEVEALIERMHKLIANPIMPDLRRRRSVPWSFR
jgi:uncharacterized repeat protein (TIGR03843 family)